MLESVTATPHLVVRPGEPHDVDRVEAMHRRCSFLSLYQRFHAPLPRVSTRMVRQLVAPAAGWSLLAQVDHDVVGFACAAEVSASEVEVGLLVEDRHQRNGIGARLLHAMATEAGSRGFESLECVAQPDNVAVLATVRRAGLIGRAVWHDGLVRVSVPLRGRPDGDLPRTA